MVCVTGAYITTVKFKKAMRPPPPPTSNDCPIQRLEPLQNAHRAFQRTFARTLQIFDMSKTPRDLLRSPTTPDDDRPGATTFNGHLAPLLRPPTFLCVLRPFRER